MTGNELLSGSHFSVNRSRQLDLAYNEYCRQREAGENVDAEAFCARFPDVQSSLRRQLEVHLYLEENPEALAEWHEVSWPEPGQMFLGFSLIRELGRGGFARVFLAVEPALGGRLVVVKISPQGAAEAHILGRLNHPHIVPINSVQSDSSSGLTAVCMPFLGGTTLLEVVERLANTSSRPRSARIFFEASAAGASASEVPPETLNLAARVWRGNYVDGVLRLGIALAEALDLAHRRGVWHRDLKPSNVLLAADGRPMLLDFNLSADESLPDDRLGGTLPYMAPEQLRALNADGTPEPINIGAPSDLFAPGVILYELLVGRHPFGPIAPGTSLRELRAQLLRRQEAGPLSLSLARPELDNNLIRIIERCLAHQPGLRPTTAAELAAELKHASRWHRRTFRWAKRHKSLVASLLLAVGVAAGVTGVAVGSREPYPLREHHSGLDHYRRGEYTEALDAFNRSVDADPSSAATYFARGRARQRLGTYDRALDDYVVAQRLADNGETWACIGYCAARLRRFDEAIYSFQKALDMGFTPAEVHNDFAYCLQQYPKALPDSLGNAKKHLDIAIDKNQQLQAAYYNRSLLHLQISSSRSTSPNPEGLDDIKKALDLGPKTTDILRIAADLHARANWRRAAIGFLLEANQLGLTLEEINQDRHLDPLRSEDAYRHLKSPPPSQLPSRAVRLLDPIADRSR